ERCVSNLDYKNTIHSPSNMRNTSCRHAGFDQSLQIGENKICMKFRMSKDLQQSVSIQPSD
ncbi:17106_t:CDS:1, partial [Dentiscutata heterogama]